MTNLLLFNEDCIQGMRDRIESGSIDLIFTDPPYGIHGANLDVHYNRDEKQVIPGYVEVSKEDYPEFSREWISECYRCLRPGGSIYIVSGYTHLRHILNAMAEIGFQEINHLIAEYSFGVYTTRKWVSSHYHILFQVKPPESKRTFISDCRTLTSQQSYNDRISVQKLIRDYKPGETKNVNQLSVEFVSKFILYSSNEGDLVLDPFSGSFSTGRACIMNRRRFIGFEKNPESFDHFSKELLQPDFDNFFE